MNIENTTKLHIAYPLLYRELRDSGFECKDGWFNLVWKLSAEIESTAIIEGIPKDSDTWPAITILKQKFGSLRVSFKAPVSETIHILVRKAEELSLLTCELCGEPAYRDRESEQVRWPESLCTNCRKAYRSPQQSQDKARPPPVWKQERDNDSK